MKDKYENAALSLEKHLELDDRIYSLNMKDCFITVKDYKDNYENNKLGKVSKLMLSQIVVREKHSIIIGKTPRTR